MNDLRRFERFAVGDHVRIDDGSEWVLTAAAVANPWVWVQGSTEFADQMVSPMWIRQRHGRLLTATVRVDGSELLHYAAEQCVERAEGSDTPRGADWSTAATQLRHLIREGWGADLAVTGLVTRSAP